MTRRHVVVVVLKTADYVEPLHILLVAICGNSLTEHLSADDGNIQGQGWMVNDLALLVAHNKCLASVKQ